MTQWLASPLWSAGICVAKTVVVVGDAARLQTELARFGAVSVVKP